MVSNHNRHYPSEGGFNCEDETRWAEGCCKVTTECDLRGRLEGMVGKIDDMSNEYKERNLVERKGIEGCPSVNGLMNEYYTGYPSRDDQGIQALLIIGGLVMLYVACNMCTK